MDSVVVETTVGKLRGTEHNGFYTFKGIPYGAPTGGEMRFMPSEKPSPWTGVRDVFKFGHQSPLNMHYTDMLSPQADASVKGYSEDFLYLNVWTPGPNTSSKRPVMFWCHGGGFGQESGTWPWVAALIASPPARGLFQQAIIQSGKRKPGINFQDWH